MSTNDYCDYELQRLENIQKNQQILAQLEIAKVKPVIPKKVAGVKRKADRISDGSNDPPRRSSRLSNQPVKHVEIPTNFIEPRVRQHTPLRRMKNPPVVSMEDVDYSVTAALPTKGSNGKYKFADVPHFTPSLSPHEVLTAGAFGGGYFRPIYSRIVKEHIKDDYKEFPASLFQGLNMKEQVLKSEYDESVNKYKIKAGQTLEDWEAAGWIAAQDPRGWFQWYCRFYYGRRSPDDERQIARWNGVCGPNGRWKKDLVAKVIRSGKAYNDAKVSPQVRQTLLHWAYDLTEAEFNAYS